MHSDVLGQLNVAAFQNNRYTDLVAVQVTTNHITFNASQATDVDVFANLADQYQASSFLSFDQRSDVSQLVGERFFNASGNKCLEVVLQSQEVSLRVHFQQDCGFTVFLQSDSAFSSNVACFLAALMAPEARMSSMAFSMSPPALVKAFCSPSCLRQYARAVL